MKAQLMIGAALMLSPLGFASSVKAADPPLTVTVSSCSPGSVTGFVGDFPGGTTGSMRQFLGLPYAAPPAGSNRWQPPKAFPCWSNNRPAISFGNTCPQGAAGNEDCLFLNIFTPATGTVKKLPVMVFIHGGALTGGSGSLPQTNPVALVNQGVVVVTLNYRLGAFGFLAHSALDRVSAKRTGNYGIQDQQAALTWIKKNITGFGGNPKNVTIFGQSAGGLSVLTHLVSPLSAGLFHKAIIESGALYATPSTLSAAEATGSIFANQVGCSGSGAASCLRGLPVSTILAHQSTLGQSTQLLRVDNLVLKDMIANLLTSGKFQNVPIINGSNHDEQRFHLALNTNPTIGSGTSCNYTSNITPANYSSAMQTAFGGQTSQVVAQYPAGGSDLSANIGFTASQSDRNFICRALHVDQWIAQKNGTLYAYEFNDEKSPLTSTGPLKLADGTNFPFGAYHNVELQYIFQMPKKTTCNVNYSKLSSAQKKLSAAMVTYWTTFAKTGNPNPTTGTIPPAWPQFQKTNSQMLSLIAAKPKAINASSFDADHKCSSFWFSNSP